MFMKLKPQTHLITDLFNKGFIVISLFSLLTKSPDAALNAGAHSFNSFLVLFYYVLWHLRSCHIGLQCQTSHCLFPTHAIMSSILAFLSCHCSDRLCILYLACCKSLQHQLAVCKMAPVARTVCPSRLKGTVSFQ
jgi:hypothetical protein